MELIKVGKDASMPDDWKNSTIPLHKIMIISKYPKTTNGGLVC